MILEEFTAAEQETIVYLYTNHLNTVAIAKKLKCRTSRICDVLRLKGIDVYANKGFRSNLARSGVPNPSIVNEDSGILNEVTECQWAYLAGIFDGEGCLTKDNHQHGSFSYRLVVSMAIHPDSIFCYGL